VGVAVGSAVGVSMALGTAVAIAVSGVDAGPQAAISNEAITINVRYKLLRFMVLPPYVT
jgi:hypothetical protein